MSSTSKTQSFSFGELHPSRKRGDNVSKFFFTISNLIAILALVILLLTVVNQAFTIVGTIDTIDRSSLIDAPVESLSQTQLISLLEGNLTANRIKTLDRDLPLVERSQAQLVQLVESEVFKTSIVASYNLFDALLHSESLKAQILSEYPQAKITMRSWINWNFISNAMAKKPEEAGIRTAILGSFFIILLAILVSFPLGVSTAIYLEEYARQNKSSRKADPIEYR